tara:strand:+ start:271 stop:585 length:315 start_codon:yes stop_codon:yes gene_type:complete
MRKVTEEIAKAFKKGINKTVGNTATIDGAVFLHGNKIAKIEDGALLVSLAGWNTPTTRERLNGIAEIFDTRQKFRQIDFEPYLCAPWGDRLVRDDCWEWMGEVK